MGFLSKIKTFLESPPSWVEAERLREEEATRGMTEQQKTEYRNMRRKEEWEECARRVERADRYQNASSFFAEATAGRATFVKRPPPIIGKPIPILGTRILYMKRW